MPAPAAPEDSSCVAALDSMVAIFRRDYPGYRDKVSRHEEALTALTDSVRAVARTSEHHSVCIPALQRWARFFRDPHITGPWQSSPPPPRTDSGAGAANPVPRADDPDRPSIRFLDDSTAVARLPTLEPEYRPAIDSVVGANRPELETTAYLIVDVRGNGGGYTGSYASLTPLLYANPLHLYGEDVWASPANTAHVRDMLTNPYLRPTDRALTKDVVSRMAAHVGEFVERTPDMIIRRDTVYRMPRSVAVLVDSGCASSCEDFVLETRQSAKVTVLGVGHTAGVHDYGDVRGAWLPGWRRVALPTTRARGPRIDYIGLSPSVRIPKTETDPVAFARRYLHSSRRVRGSLPGNTARPAAAAETTGDGHWSRPPQMRPTMASAVN